MKKFLAVFCTLAMVLSLSACSSSSTVSGGTAAKPSTASAGSKNAASDSTGKKMQFTMGTATTGGFTYVYGAAMAEIINKYCTDINVTSAITTGGDEDLYNIMGGQMQMGIVGSNLASKFYKGNKEDKIDPQTNMRTLWTSKPTCASVIVPSKSPYTCLNDLRGKKISIGNQSGSAYDAILALLSALGYSKSDFNLQYLTMEESESAMTMGTIDAFFTFTTDPHSAMTELFTSGSSYRFLDWSDKELNTIKKAIPYLKDTIRPAKTYKGQDKDFHSIGSPYAVVVTTDFPESVAYEIAKCLDTHYDELVNVASGCKGSTLKNTIQTYPIPLHPGVEKYAKEKGLMK